jgi:hypothetical protein
MLRLAANLGTPPLPPVPIFDRLVESPWPLVGFLILLGVVSFWAFNSRGQARRGVVVAGVMLGLAGAISLAAVLIVTQREALRARSVELTGAVAEGDVQTVRSILHPSARAYWRDAREGWPVERVVEFIQEEMQRAYAVHSHRVRQVEAAIDGPEVARTQVHLTIVPEATRTPLQMVVRLDWQRIDAEWRVVRVSPMSIQGFGDISGP